VGNVLDDVPPARGAHLSASSTVRPHRYPKIALDGDVAVIGGGALSTRSTEVADRVHRTRYVLVAGEHRLARLVGQTRPASSHAPPCPRQARDRNPR